MINITKKLLFSSAFNEKEDSLQKISYIGNNFKVPQKYKTHCELEIKKNPWTYINLFDSFFDGVVARVLKNNQFGF